MLGCFLTAFDAAASFFNDDNIIIICLSEKQLQYSVNETNEKNSPGPQHDQTTQKRVLAATR